MMLKRSAVFLLLTTPTWFCALPAFGQGGSIGTGAVMFRVEQGATDRPFTAEMITTQVQTLSDGTQITRVSKRSRCVTRRAERERRSIFPRTCARDLRAATHRRSSPLLIPWLAR